MEQIHQRIISGVWGIFFAIFFILNRKILRKLFFDRICDFFLLKKDMITKQTGVINVSVDQW